MHFLLSFPFLFFLDLILLSKSSEHQLGAFAHSFLFVLFVCKNSEFAICVVVLVFGNFVEELAKIEIFEVVERKGCGS